MLGDQRRHVLGAGVVGEDDGCPHVEAEVDQRVVAEDVEQRDHGEDHLSRRSQVDGERIDRAEARVDVGVGENRRFWHAGRTAREEQDRRGGRLDRLHGRWRGAVEVGRHDRTVGSDRRGDAGTTEELGGDEHDLRVDGVELPGQLGRRRRGVERHQRRAQTDGGQVGDDEADLVPEDHRDPVARCHPELLEPTPPASGAIAELAIGHDLVGGDDRRVGCRMGEQSVDEVHAGDFSTRRPAVSSYPGAGP